MYLDDELGRLMPRRVNLSDDAWTKVTDLRLLLRSLMNVQINQHHPEDKAKGLLYSIKYETKPEPATKVGAAHEFDDSVTKFFRGQFMSVSFASAFLHEHDVTQCTLPEQPLVFPAWTIDFKTQGIWKRYLERLPCLGMDDNRE